MITIPCRTLLPSSAIVINMYDKPFIDFYEASIVNGNAGTILCFLVQFQSIYTQSRGTLVYLQRPDTGQLNLYIDLWNNPGINWTGGSLGAHKSTF